MLNKRCSDIFEYNKQTMYYKFVAMLYDKISDDGFIAETDYYCPISNDYEKYDILLRDIADKNDCLKVIDNIIVEKNLNVEFCNKLCDSASLRYIFAIGFHDVPIVKAVIENNEYKLLLDCGNANYKPKNCKDIVEVRFEKFTVDQNDLQKEPYEYYYDRQEIYCLDDGNLMVILGMNNRGEVLKTIELQIIAGNIIIS